jgi:hypothetical protein
MPPDWMPGAVRKPIAYRNDAGNFAAAPLGWILHVVVGNGSPYGIFKNAVPPYRRFSHFWVSKLGVIEQYAETSNKSWAQGGGNTSYWSVETEGFPSEPLNAAQIVALAAIHKFLGADDAIAHSPGQRGIGTHYMGGSAWGGHSCPDPENHEGDGPRSLQRDDIITAAQPPPAPKSQENEVTVFARFAAPHPKAGALYVTNLIERRGVVSEDYRNKMIATGVSYADADIYGFTTDAGMNAFAGELKANGDGTRTDYNPTTNAWERA